MGSGRSWTPEQVRTLGVTTTLPVAASTLGIGRTMAYQLVAAGRFPVAVIRAGSRLIVPVAPLLALLGIEPTPVGDSDRPRLDRAGDRSVDRAAPADSTDTEGRGFADDEQEGRR